jgi:hypothetical protein
MNSKQRITMVVAGLVFTLGGTVSWGGNAKPTINDFSDANQNTAGGTNALQSNTSGEFNAAFGFQALLKNTTGSSNTAFGDRALQDHVEGTENTAVGDGALESDTSGNDNTAVGMFAILFNTTGSSNTAVGAHALSFNGTGLSNTASGTQALLHNTSGSDNTATGVNALFANSTGHDNTADGPLALHSNATGSYNSALGYQALYNSTGSRNIAIGFNAGFHLSSGDKNIYLGNTGVASESTTMRLGSVQTRTFITGIAGVPISGATVTINNAGQLGIVASSARYKRDIATMGERSQGLYSLRPVTFRYKQDSQGQRQYGLIAEEVAKIYPELVTKGADGKVESVQYHELIPMLLNEVQRQQQQLAAQAQELAELKAQAQQVTELKAQNAALAARLERLEAGAVHAAAVVIH